MEIPTPIIFSFEECLRYLNRTDHELTYRVVDRSVFKLVAIKDRKILINVKPSGSDKLLVNILNHQVTYDTELEIRDYVSEWFDLDTQLDQFYRDVEGEEIFKTLTQKYYGLRMLRIPELFEAICWSIIGQQINLRFAYQLKHNLVKKLGEYLDFDGCRYYLFPTPDKLAELNDEIFRSLQFSKQKASYIKDVAKKFVSGKLDKQRLKGLEPEELKTELMKIKGIGNWSSNYVMMRCLGIKEAFPVEDVGLHNALKNVLVLNSKPKLEEVIEVSKDWNTWKAYRTYYLWHSLIHT